MEYRSSPAACLERIRNELAQHELAIRANTGDVARVVKMVGRNEEIVDWKFEGIPCRKDLGPINETRGRYFSERRQ